MNLGRWLRRAEKRYAETGAAIPKEPILFNKAPSCISGPNDPVLLPRKSVKTDWEVELAFVIGKTTVSQAEAALGEPNAVSTTPDGSILLVYTAANTSARASAFTRLAGLFGGGDDTKPQNAVLHFGLDRTYQGATSEAEGK